MLCEPKVWKFTARGPSFIRPSFSADSRDKSVSPFLTMGRCNFGSTTDLNWCSCVVGMCRWLLEMLFSTLIWFICVSELSKLVKFSAVLFKTSLEILEFFFCVGEWSNWALIDPSAAYVFFGDMIGNCY